MMPARASLPPPAAAGDKAAAGPRWSRTARDSVLWLRRPFRALCGSLRVAIIALAAGFSVFLLSEATFLTSVRNIQTMKGPHSTHDYSILIGVDLLVAAANVGLIFGAITTKLNFLHGWMSVALVDLLVAVAAVFWLSFDMGLSTPFFFIFQICHIIFQTLLLCLVYGMAHELRGGRFFDYGGIDIDMGDGGGGGGRGGGGEDGWLHYNLSHVVPPAPGYPSSKPNSPAVLEPSACTTAPSPAPPPPQPVNSHC